VTVADALATIEARLAVRLAASGRHAVYLSLAERLEKLRQRSTAHAQAAIDFLRELLDVARVLLAAERVEESEGDVSLLPEPNLGALTQILNEYAERREPEVIRSVVSDIDAIVKEVRFSGWTTSQPGDRTVKREIRRVLRRYMLPATGEIFEKTYAYVRENY
jgi:type I restriction enzyme R subunit